MKNTGMKENSTSNSSKLKVTDKIVGQIKQFTVTHAMAHIQLVNSTIEHENIQT